MLVGKFESPRVEISAVICNWSTKKTMQPELRAQRFNATLRAHGARQFFCDRVYQVLLLRLNI
jgi:hypothetical protein